MFVHNTLKSLPVTIVLGRTCWRGHTESAFSVGMSYVEQWQECGGLPKSVRLLPANKDASLVEMEAIVVGAVGTGAPLCLTGWVEGTEVEFTIDTGCQ